MEDFDSNLNSRDEICEDNWCQGSAFDRVLVRPVIALQTRDDHPHQVKSLVLANGVAQVKGAENVWTKD